MSKKEIQNEQLNDVNGGIMKGGAHAGIGDLIPDYEDEPTGYMCGNCKKFTVVYRKYKDGTTELICKTCGNKIHG